MPEVQSEGVRIDYTDAGRGEPVLLLLPGWCATRAVFGELARLCASHRRVLALDWRGHGASESATGDFGAVELVKDAFAVVEASGAQQVVPVALAHAGWVAIELRRKLGERIPKIILLDWIIFAPPASFESALVALQDEHQCEHTRDRLLSGWLEGVTNPAVSEFVHHVMGDLVSACGRAPAGRFLRLMRDTAIRFGLSKGLLPLSRYFIFTRSQWTLRTGTRNCFSQSRIPGSAHGALMPSVISLCWKYPEK